MNSAFVGYLAINELRQLRQYPHGTLSQQPMRPKAWAIDSEPIRAQGIIVKYPTKAEFITCFMSDFSTTN